MNDKLTIIVPCFNEEEVLPNFFEKISELIEEMEKSVSVSFELLFVDDGSTDNTLELVKKFAVEKKEAGYISFSRNFGKESAIYAGLEHSSGNYVAMMDADLQDPPELLKTMYETIRAGDCDCVGSRRVTRSGEPVIRSFLARCFYKIMRKISGLEIVDGARDFRLMTRQMTDSIISLTETNRFSKGLFVWVGYKTKWIEFENTERQLGTTKWSFFKLLFYAFDGIAAFSSVPLAVVSVTGILFLFLSILIIIFIIVRKIMWGDPVAGWPSLICVIFFTTGTQCFFTGILGYYISKIYSEVKRRPQYILRESHNLLK